MVRLCGHAMHEKLAAPAAAVSLLLFFAFLLFAPAAQAWTDSTGPEKPYAWIDPKVVPDFKSGPSASTMMDGGNGTRAAYSNRHHDLLPQLDLERGRELTYSQHGNRIILNDVLDPMEPGVSFRYKIYLQKAPSTVDLRFGSPR